MRAFRGLSKRNLFALAVRTNAMKTPAGRAKKIAMLVEMLARGEIARSAPKPPPKAVDARKRPRRTGRRAPAKRAARS